MQIILFFKTSFICKQSYDFKCGNVIPIIHFLHTVKLFHVFHTNSLFAQLMVPSIVMQNKWLNLNIQLKGFSYCYETQAIQFNINYLFANNEMVKQSYLKQRWDPNKCYHSGSEWTWEYQQWKGTLYSQ